MSESKNYTYDKETGKYKYAPEGIARRTAYNKDNYVGISFTMKPEDYDMFAAAADKAGMKFASWVKLACERMMTEK